MPDIFSFCLHVLCVCLRVNCSRPGLGSDRSPQPTDGTTSSRSRPALDSNLKLASEKVSQRNSSTFHGMLIQLLCRRTDYAEDKDMCVVSKTMYQVPGSHLRARSSPSQPQFRRTKQLQYIDTFALEHSRVWTLCTLFFASFLSYCKTVSANVSSFAQ